MAYYDKKIVYLSEMEYGSKIRGAGFVRMEFYGEACSLDMQVSGMTELPDGKYGISVISVWGKECEVGKIYIHNGKGEWKERYENGHLPESLSQGADRSKGGLSCFEIAELRIRTSDTKVISGKTGFARDYVKAAQMPEKVKEDIQVSALDTATVHKKEKWYWGERPGRRWEFRRSEPMDKKEAGDKSENEEFKESREAEESSRECLKILETVQKEDRVVEDDFATNETEKPEQVRVMKEPEIAMDAIILNDKWDQLRQIYSVVHPYEDDREYISVQPKDFVIMTGDYQHLANNSFLLHGFYNYRHIILGREPDGCFYLGVPGVYYEREKMVALMFGFEAFECSGGKAEAGKFGYYLRKVRI